VKLGRILGSRRSLFDGLITCASRVTLRCSPLAPPCNFKRHSRLEFNNYLRSALTLRGVSSGRDVWPTGTRRAEFLPCHPKSLEGRAVLDVCGAHTTTIEASGMLDHPKHRPQLTPLGDQVRPRLRRQGRRSTPTTRGPTGELRNKPRHTGHRNY
jgi:hypothetical protein